LVRANEGVKVGFREITHDASQKWRWQIRSTAAMYQQRRSDYRHRLQIFVLQAVFHQHAQQLDMEHRLPISAFGF
jgi:hypothetical protein